MKRLLLLSICMLILTGCQTKAPEIDLDQSLLNDYEEELESLEKELEMKDEELEGLNKRIESLELDYSLLIEENKTLLVKMEDLESKEEIDDPLAFTETLVLRDDIATSEYTIEELSELFPKVQDGSDLNMYGGNLALIFFELGIREFISEVTKLDDEEAFKTIAGAFLYSMTSNRELYYTNDIDSKLILQELENEFFNIKNHNLSDKENEFAQIFLNEIWNMYEWFE